MSACRSCSRPITWATNTKTGKPMPIDPEPVVGGNVVLTGEGPHQAEVVGKAEVERRRGLGLRLHVSHFTTCPQAGDWRR